MHIILSLFFIITLVFIWEPSVFANSVWQVQISRTIDTSRVVAREKMIYRVMSSSTFLRYTYEPLSILIDHTLVEPRWRIKWRDISLSSLIARDSEFLKLLVHELAHFVDIYMLPNKWGKDISHDFYKISWQNSTTKRAWQKQQNFISGYAATNQYEDFAESFVFYIFHNRVFEDRALRDDTIRQKYLFLQSYIFPNGTFVDTDFSLGRMPAYTWDTTKLPISLQKYLYSLN